MAVCPAYLRDLKEASVASLSRVGRVGGEGVHVVGEFEKKKGVKDDNKDFSLNS